MLSTSVSGSIALNAGPTHSAPAALACPACGRALERYREDGPNLHKRGTFECHGCKRRWNKEELEQAAAASQATPLEHRSAEGTSVASKGAPCRYCGAPFDATDQQTWCVSKDGRRYPVGHPVWYCKRAECQIARKRAGNRTRQQRRRDAKARERQERDEQWRARQRSRAVS
jgi:hypothetical protein